MPSSFNAFRASKSAISRFGPQALHDVAPPALLVAALQGLASAWGIHQMAGIWGRSQFCYDEKSAALFQESYDDFFVELGATRDAADFYSSPLPVIEKSVDQIRNGHKSRTRKKRAFKLEIARQVRCQIEFASTSWKLTSELTQREQKTGATMILGIPTNSQFL